MFSDKNHITQPIITKWGEYQIAVTVAPRSTKSGGFTSSYEISEGGSIIAAGRVPASFATVADAAESALRIAKLDARESLDGPFPAL